MAHLRRVEEGGVSDNVPKCCDGDFTITSQAQCLAWPRWRHTVCHIPQECVALLSHVRRDSRAATWAVVKAKFMRAVNR